MEEDAMELQCVKHLNPRQGITTHAAVLDQMAAWYEHGVKHLNPRQGITTYKYTFVVSNCRVAFV